MKKYLLKFSHIICEKFYPHECGGPHAPTLRRTKCVMHHLLFLIVIDPSFNFNHRRTKNSDRHSELPNPAQRCDLRSLVGAKISLLKVGVLGFVVFFELGLHPPFLPVSLGYIRSLLKGRISWNYLWVVGFPTGFESRSGKILPRFAIIVPVHFVWFFSPACLFSCQDCRVWV